MDNDGVHVYKLLIHRSRVNSSLCLEKSGCSQTLIKVGGVLIYKWLKWVEHVPDKMAVWFQENCSENSLIDFKKITIKGIILHIE